MDRRRFARRAPRDQCGCALRGGGVEPIEGDEVAVEKLAGEGGVLAGGGADELEPSEAGADEQVAADLERDQELFTQAGHHAQQFAHLIGRDAQHAGGAARDGGDDDRAAGEHVDVAGEFARLVGDDQRVVLGGIEDVEEARLDDEEVAVGLPGAEGRLAVGQVLRAGDGADVGDVRAGELKKGGSVWEVFKLGLRQIVNRRRHGRSW